LDVSFGGTVRLDFKFDATSDLTGQAMVTNFSGNISPANSFPPSVIAGTRLDFLKSIVSIDQIDITQTLFIPGNISGNFSAGGSMEIIYNYTPIPTPEPATLLFLGSGLIGLVGLRRKFRK